MSDYSEDDPVVPYLKLWHCEQEIGSLQKNRNYLVLILFLGFICILYLFYLISEETKILDQEKKKLENDLLKSQKKTNQLRTKLTDETGKQISLCLAVANKEKEKAKILIKESFMDVNQCMKLKNGLEGPVLLLAVQNRDHQMMRMLVEDFRADVNKEVKQDGKQSTLLIFGMWLCIMR
jgi:hypothetical protein